MSLIIAERGKGKKGREKVQAVSRQKEKAFKGLRKISSRRGVRASEDCEGTEAQQRKNFESPGPGKEKKGNQTRFRIPAGDGFRKKEGLCSFPPRQGGEGRGGGETRRCVRRERKETRSPWP